MQKYLMPYPQQAKPKRYEGPGLRRWTLATIAYCPTCRRRTSQSALTEIKGAWVETETYCYECHQVTSRQRQPARPPTGEPPLSQAALW